MCLRIFYSGLLHSYCHPVVTRRKHVTLNGTGRIAGMLPPPLSYRWFCLCFLLYLHQHSAVALNGNIESNQTFPLLTSTNVPPPLGITRQNVFNRKFSSRPSQLDLLVAVETCEMSSAIHSEEKGPSI